MSLKDYKITEQQVAQNGMVSVPDRLTGNAQENKSLFDRLVREIVRASINGLVEQLLDPAAAGELGFAPVEGLEADNLQRAVEQLAENLRETEEKAVGAVADMTVSGSFASADSDAPYVEKEIDEEGKVNLHFNVRSGVYVGEGEMPEDCNVQVNPYGNVLTMEDLMGGHYTPSVTQLTEDTAQMEFIRSTQNIPEIPKVTIRLPKGKDGDTPARGMDYWTEADKDEITNDVLQNIYGSATVKDGVLVVDSKINHTAKIEDNILVIG